MTTKRERRRRRKQPDVRVIVHNVYVGQSADSALGNLGRLAKRFDPDGFALQEAGRLHGRTLPGYSTIEDPRPDHPDDRQNRVLIRDGLQVGSMPSLVSVNAPNWRGPKRGLEHPPRLFVGDTMRTEHDRRARVRLLSVHRVPGGPTSRLPGGAANWRAEHESLVAYAARNTDDPLVLAGDWNCGASNRHPTAVRALANRIRGILAIRGVDGVIVRGFSKVRVRRLFRKYGSDGHRPVVVDLWL